MKFVKDAADVLGPAQAPEGRFHYGGQNALYLSETPDGTIIATKAYMTADDPQRAIFPLWVEKAHIVDLRDPSACAVLGIDITYRTSNWRDIRATGASSPTWEISDRVRELDLDGMLYASRSQPGLSHLTLFKWNCDNAATVTTRGPQIPFAQN